MRTVNSPIKGLTGFLASALMAISAASWGGACTFSDLAAWYPADNTTMDLAKGNDGVLLGGATYGPGKISNAFSLNGTSAYVETSSTLANDPISSGSLEAWVNFNTLPSVAGHIMQIIGKGNTNNFFDLQAHQDNKFHFFVGAGFTVASTTIVQTDVWYHIVATWDNNTSIRMYVNGVLENEDFENTLRGASGLPLQIGAQPSIPGRNFAGLIDDVQVYDRALTYPEVYSLYNGGETGNCIPFNSFVDDQFTTSTDSWQQFGIADSVQNVDYDSTLTTLINTIASSSNGYRIIGWFNPSSGSLHYSSVGTDHFVRGKYYIYAGGQTGNALNEIPNFRIRVANRFAVSSILQVYNHLNSDPEGTKLGEDIRPSTSSLSPSVYRVDLDPIDVPYLVTNANTESFLRLFETYEPNQQGNGNLYLTECQLGVYPALADSSTLVPVTQNGLIKSYQPGVSDGGDFGNGNIGSSNSSITIAKYFNGSEETTPPLPSVNITNAGVTLETLSVQSDRFSAAALDVFNTVSDLSNHLTRARIEPYKQYRIRFHATSTKQTNTQSVMRFRARTLKFQWTNMLEVGGSQAASVANNTIAQQALPGIGNEIPAFDRINSLENGGWYNVMMVSPMSSEIQASQSHINAQDPPGVDTQPGNNSKSRRDLQFGIDVIDTFTTQAGGATESGQMTVNRVNIEKFDLILD